MLLFALLILCYAIIALDNKPKAQQQTFRRRQRQETTATTTANAELLQALLYSVDSLEDERERLSRDCEMAIDTKNTKRFEKNAKHIDRITEQIARKHVQIAKLQDKLTRTF